MYFYMSERQKYLISEIARCKKMIAGAPQGELFVAGNGTSTKWYVKEPNKPRVLLHKSEKERASELANKKIESNRLKELEKELYAVNLYLNHCFMGVGFETIDKNSRYLKIINHGYESISNKENKWLAEPFNTNQAYLSEKIHSSPSGHMLRSKSEVLIDTALFEAGIVFRYEMEIIIGVEHFYPDFTIYKAKTNEVRYWEHNGMMDNQKYQKRYLKKEEAYLKANIIPGYNLINTYETSYHPLTYNEIKKNVDDILLWLRV